MRPRHYFSQAVTAAPQSGQAHYNYALALNALGDTEEARQHFIEAANLAPGDKTIWDSPALHQYGNPQTEKDTKEHRTTTSRPTFGGSPPMVRERIETMAKEIAVGDKAPDLSLPDHTGKPVTLKSLKGKQIVLYFYPKDDTPGCTKESCDFRDVESQIMRAGGRHPRSQSRRQGVAPKIREKIWLAVSLAQR